MLVNWIFPLLFILPHIFAAPTTQCPKTTAIPNPTSIANVQVASFIVPNTINIQTIPAKNGESWSFAFTGYDNRVTKLSAEFIVQGTKLIAQVHDAAVHNSAISRFSSSAELTWLIMGLMLSVGFFNFSSKTLWIMGFILFSICSLPTILSANTVDCNRGTLIITYPPQVQILINGQSLNICTTATTSSGIQSPVVQKVINSNLNTFWFSSPVVLDLDQDPNCTMNCKEIIVCGTGCWVFNSSYSLLPQCTGGVTSCSVSNSILATPQRVYAPQVVTDLDGNGKMDLCVGTAGSSSDPGARVHCWEWNSATRQFSPRKGFPAKLSGQSSGAEVRGIAAADVDNDGLIEIFVSTTDSSVQIFAFKPDGSSLKGWPRYNTLTGTLDDGTPGRNGPGHGRYGAYGLNLGIGNINEDSFLEIITTYDDHQIQAFRYDGIAINVAKNFTNPSSKYLNKPLTWGQTTARWENYTTEINHYQNHECWPYPGPSGHSGCDGTPCVITGDSWFQFTQSPANVIDIDGDGESEVISLPNTENGFNDACNYITQYRSLFVLDGAYDGNSDPTYTNYTKSGLRHTGFDGEIPPHGKKITCQDCYSSGQNCTCRTQSWYPPEAVPSISFGINSDPTLTNGIFMVFSFGDATISSYNNAGTLRWSFDFASDTGIDNQVHAIDSSEPVLADLNGDGIVEVIFTTYGFPTKPQSNENNQHLYILDSRNGNKLFRIPLNTNTTKGDTGGNGNGNGPAGAPTIADVDGDGQLEILIHTFDGRFIVFTVPGSSSNCLVWPTGRGGYLRKGQNDY